MSMGPGPTRKPDGSADASVDDIADLLVEDETQNKQNASEPAADLPVEDSLDVLLETPGPALVNNFMPPPPSPPAGVNEEAESAEEPSGGGNLAYEDLLAKLVLPAKAPEPEPDMPALVSPMPAPIPPSLAQASLPVASPLSAPLPASPSASFKRPSAHTLPVAQSTEERTLVTENPLLAEEQQAARAASREQPVLVHEEVHPLATEPVPAAANQSKLLYLMLGGLLVIGVGILSVLVIRVFFMPAATQTQGPVVIPPSPPLPPPAPPAKVEPLPPSAAPVPTPAAEPAAAAPEPAAPTEAPAPPEPEKTQAKPRKTTAHAKPAHSAAPKPAPAAKPAAPAPAPAAKPAKAPASPAGKKPAKSGWVDPFDN